MIRGAPQNKMLGRRMVTSVKLTEGEIEELKRTGYVRREIDIAPNSDKPCATAQEIALRPGAWDDR